MPLVASLYKHSSLYKGFPFTEYFIGKFKMSLRIGMVHSDLPEEGKKPGGVYVAVHELANALVRNGNLVRFYSHTPKPKDAIYQVINLPQVTKSRRINRRLALPLQINYLNLEGLDVLHLHGDDWAFLNRSIPTVRTFHGCALNEAKFADNIKAKIVHALYHPLEIWASKLANCSIGVGDDTIKLLGAKYVIPNGYDENLFYPGQKSPTPTAIVVGALNGRKQSKLAIELLLSLQNEIPGLIIHAVIDKPYNHPSVQSWTGISKEHLAKLVRESWIGVSTTLYEGFGMYYLEWMAAGTVPITFSNIGTRSLICDSKAGILAETSSELRDGALHILRDSSARDKYSMNGVAAAQLLTWDNIAQQYMKIYFEVLSNHEKFPALAE
jgi:glycosyltransferase involved in cell wall biosynthesis